MMICSFTVYRNDGTAKDFQFGFHGGYVGWIVAHAKRVARQQRGRLVDLTDDGVLVDCQAPRNERAEWIGTL